MLDVCKKLEAYLGLPRLLFQIIFVIWFFHNHCALGWYILLFFLL